MKRKNVPSLYLTSSTICNLHLYAFLYRIIFFQLQIDYQLLKNEATRVRKTRREYIGRVYIRKKRREERKDSGGERKKEREREMEN